MSGTDTTEATASIPDPVASVLVDTGLAHLDRPFEYAVPADLAEAAQPGVRVRVRFAGRDLAGYVVARQARAEHEGRLAPLRTVVSPEPVLTPSTLALAQELARRCAGTVGDVLRLAIPPRHAAAEKALPGAAPEAGELPALPGASAWERYAAGPAFVARVRSGECPAAAWLALPPTGRDADARAAQDWPAALAEAARAAYDAGRGALIVVPDHRDLARVEERLRTVLGKTRVARLSADQGPQARYTQWLRVLRGHARVVVGTRAAAFAPVHDLGLVAWWDDGDDLHAEPRAPYPHVREVLRLRAGLEGCALLVGGASRSTAVQQLVESGAVQPVDGLARWGRGAVPRVLVAGEGQDRERDPSAARAHLPTLAWRTAKEALARGPVLIQVPRRGYLPALTCQDCRTPSRCRHCGGRLALPGPTAPPACRWCGRVDLHPTCQECGSSRLRSSAVGVRRTAEEVGRAFPGTAVVTSGGSQVLAEVGAEPAIVLATPGAEPVAPQGYSAVLLLDAWASLDRPSLDAGEEAVRRWLGAALLGRPGDEGGVVVLGGAPQHESLPAVEALVRWAPSWFAGRELAERAALRLPPAVPLGAVSGERAGVQAAADSLASLPGVETIGPLQTGEDSWRLLVRAPEAQRQALADRLRELRGERSAHRELSAIQVRTSVTDLDL